VNATPPPPTWASRSATIVHVVFAAMVVVGLRAGSTWLFATGTVGALSRAAWLIPDLAADRRSGSVAVRLAGWSGDALLVAVAVVSFLNEVAFPWFSIVFAALGAAGPCGFLSRRVLGRRVGEAVR
jgi:hypothetical protein